MNMDHFLFMHEYRKYFSCQSAFAVAFFFLLSFLPACGTTGLSQSVTAGEPKNSVPFFEKSMVEEIHSLAVPPFDRDQQNWQTIAIDILSAGGKLSVVSPEKISTFLRSSAKNLSSLNQEERLVFMARLGKAVQADAVLNGVFFKSNGRNEIILQIVSVKDSRILWWQAADLNFRAEGVSPSDQKKVLSSLLAPLMVQMGKKDAPPLAQSKQGPRSSSSINQQTEKSKSDLRPSGKPAPKTEKRHEKDLKPLPLSEDISPM